MNNIIIYHKNCNDGFGSALVAWIKFKNNAIYYPAHHNSDPPDVTNMNVYICDFSYKKEVLEKMIQISKSLIVIDHHKTAEKELQAINNENKIFDMNHSGAVLTWKYFFPEKKIPLLLEYIEDRDLWNNKLKYSKECFFALCDLPKDFETWYQYLDDERIPELFTEGSIIYNHNKLLIKQISKSSYLIEQVIDEKSYKIAYLNSIILKSDLGNYLVSEKYSESDFSVIYHYEGYDNKTIFSLRSTNEKTDVSNIAKLFNGGGHKCASGCSKDGLCNQL